MSTRSTANVRATARPSTSRANSAAPVRRRTVVRSRAYGPWRRRARALPTARDWVKPAARTDRRTRRVE
ncbi:hypothetical protein AB0C48_09960 [Streptomyces sp. NPDC048556]|uniref:hypothetical protein n=1 Tax=Streptomyces TaxID=1883 RepID=UPI0019294A24